MKPTPSWSWKTEAFSFPGVNLQLKCQSYSFKYLGDFRWSLFKKSFQTRPSSPCCPVKCSFIQLLDVQLCISFGDVQCVLGLPLLIPLTVEQYQQNEREKGRDPQHSFWPDSFICAISIKNSQLTACTGNTEWYTQAMGESFLFSLKYNVDQ